jgi:hypothetical protein
MTAKKGSLWKTSWNRGRGTPAPPKLGNMSFFTDFAEDGVLGSAAYIGSAPSTLADGLPFWFAVVGIDTDTTKSCTASPGFGPVRATSSETALASSALIGGELVLVGADAPVAAPSPYVCPVLYLVRPVGSGFSIRTIVSKGLISEYTVSTDVFTPATFPVSIAPSIGGIHGLAGGPFALTPDEITAWFDTLKSTLKIPEIPGKTTNLYSAESVAGTVPAVLPNLGSAGAAQDLDYTVLSGAPPSTNQLLSAYFTY